MIFGEIGFLWLDQTLFSCNQYKHITLFTAGKYTTKSSNYVAGLLNEQQRAENVIYREETTKLKVYEISDLFEPSKQREIYVWELDFWLDGKFDYEKMA